MSKIIYTIGHSTRSTQEFIGLLKKFDIEVLVDVRHYPGSRFCPQFSQTQLQESLLSEGIEYIHIVDLGGRRKTDKNSTLNEGWRNAQFRGYADYMQTKSFSTGIKKLISIAEKNLTAIMCAELLVWRCHRSMVADALTVRDFKVINIFNEKTAIAHKLTSFANVVRKKITYPQLKGKEKEQ